ncbi:MAG: methyltransferase domain-containing protein [Pseudomonadota bacterium]
MPPLMFLCPVCKKEIQEIDPKRLLCSGCGWENMSTDTYDFLLQEPDCRLGPLEDIIDQHKILSLFDPVKAQVVDWTHYHGVDISLEHLRLVSPYLSGAVIADMGCGQVPLVNFLAGQGLKSYYAIDAIEDLFCRAKKYINVDFPVEFVRADVSDCNLVENSVDIVICSQVIEHVDHPRNVLKEIYRILKPGGVASISTPCSSIYFYPREFQNFFRGRASRRQWLKRVHCDEHWEEMLPGHPALRPSVLRRWMKETGLDVEQHVSRGCLLDMRPAVRFCQYLERQGLPGASLLRKHIAFREWLINTKIPVLRWAGFAQFALGVKR